MKATVVASVITGFFTIAAGVVTYWVTQREPAITYSVSESPVLSGSETAKQILVVDVRNTGKKEVTDLLVQVLLSEGAIDDGAVEASPGLDVEEERGPGLFSIQAETVNPGEFTKLSLLIASQAGDIKPDVIVRAPGASASLKESNTGSEPVERPVLAATALAAVLSAMLLSSPLARRALTGYSGQSLAQNEVVAYICAKAELHEESEKLRFSSASLSYRGAADYLMFQALQVDPLARRRYLAALKAMLLNEHMSKQSAASIRRAIEATSGSSLTEEDMGQLVAKSIGEGSQPEKLRDAIDELIDAELSDTHVEVS